ncbi:MAG: ABC transporter permease [Peptococcaceae bacterium]|nr:ABC transporter permease [Peptococcaceae bacterium]
MAHAAAGPPKPLSGRLWKSMRKFPMLYLGGGIILLLSVTAIFAPWIAHYPYATQFRHGLTASGTPLPPGGRFVWGTDDLGRDVYSRVIYGSRVSMVVGVFSTLISLVIGTTLGLVSGYFGGFPDMVIMRLTDAVLAFPYFLFAMALVAVLGPSERNVLLAIGVIGWGVMARVVRGQVLAVKEFEYVQAEKAIGASTFRILFSVILPNILGPVIVLAAIAVGTNMVMEAGLSFLGIGVQEPVPSWGNMISAGLQAFQYAPWLFLIPGLALTLAVLGFNLFGDGLRDILDPRNASR